MNKDQFINKLMYVLNSDMIAFLLRVLFVAFILIGERMFLGPVTHSQGKADLLTSIGMMLIAILVVDKLGRPVVKRALLLFVVSFLIFFHLLCGLYYRFFNCALPFDIFHQWHDFFVIGGYGSGLMSGMEILIAIIIPLGLMLLILYRPVKVRPFVFIILIALTLFGWNHRLNRPINRSSGRMSFLPDYLHRQTYYWTKIGLAKSRYLQIISDVEAAIPRGLKDYKTVKNNGIMIEPVNTAQNGVQKKYNIIFILMESMRSYECGFLGASPSFTPNLDRLTEKALVYNNFYANGCQTVRAELAALCSVYSNPIGVPDYLVNPDVKLISLPEILCDTGYDTLWFSGYTADFHNKREFLTNHGVNKIYDRDVLPEAKQPEIGWGMNDCEMFENVWDVLKNTDGPFFAQITTLSNHVANDSNYPNKYEAPEAKGSEKYIKYTQGVYYTDYAVSCFIEKVRDSGLAENTIIVAMGDHGLWLFPKGISDPMQKLEIMFRVPMCIWGPEELIKPGKDDTVGSQVDLSPTLMDFLGIKHNNTFLGNSLLDQEVPSNERYVITLLGSIPHIRVGDIFSLSKSRLDKETKNIGRYAKVEKMDSYKRDSYYFMQVDGDLLHGEYTTDPITDEKLTGIYSQRIDDIVFLTSYGLYMDAYEGLED